MTYQPTRTGDEAADRQARKEEIKVRLDQKVAKIPNGKLMINPATLEDDQVVWTCASLQMMADQMDISALLTDDPNLFFIYAYTASMFQDAHDAQCTAP